MSLLPKPTDTRFDLLGIGNAIVDVLSHSEEAFLEEHGLHKGAMTLIDVDKADILYRDLGTATEVSGGSVANTVAAAGALGQRVAYIGKVRDDQLGAIFSHDIRAVGVHFDTPPAVAGPATARCFVMVTPDAHRTMATHLGACVELGPEDIDEQLVGDTWITYLEGYIWDPPRAKDALRKAIEAAHRRDRVVALTLSDPFCVERHRAEFRQLVEESVDLLFANEHELMSLYEVDDVWRAVEHLQTHCRVAAVTRGDQGSLVLSHGEVFEVPIVHAEGILDTTGAGDLYAAGFLHGVASGWDAERCGRAGAAAAAEIISHIGARPERDLREVLALATGEEVGS
ncbi:MAG: adenosine kinase [Thermoleophilia bacterium]